MVRSKGHAEERLRAQRLLDHAGTPWDVVLPKVPTVAPLPVAGLLEPMAVGLVKRSVLDRTVALLQVVQCEVRMVVLPLAGPQLAPMVATRRASRECRPRAATRLEHPCGVTLIIGAFTVAVGMDCTLVHGH